MKVRHGPIARLALGLLLLVTAVSASVEDQLSVYSEDNASGYLDPLIGAAGTDLNLGLFEPAISRPRDGS